MRGLHVAIKGMFLWLILVQTVYSQEFSIQGKVLNGETDAPLEGVICKAYDEEGTMLAYVASAKGGEVVISVESMPAYVVFSYLGFRDEKRTCSDLVQDSVVRLFAEAIEIEEIIIKSQAITQEGDTLNYSLTPFKSKEDRYLKDVLQKLPGIAVNVSGGITYQGKPINKFYMEEMDLLGTQYTLASNSLPVEAVESVQVIENNQHIKALKGLEFSENAALNIKFKEEYKQKPFGELKAGFGGAPFLSSNAGLVTFIGNKQQSLVAFKTDNTGRNIGSETIEQLDLMDVFAYESPVASYLNPTSVQHLPVHQKRYLFNETYLGSLNHLKKLAKETSLRVKFDLTKESRQQQRDYASAYDLMEEGWLTLSENRHIASATIRLNASVNYEKNRTDTYLKNELKTMAQWMDDTEEILLDTKQYHSTVTQNKLAVQNRFAYLFGKTANKYAVDAFVKYVTQPETMRLNAFLKESSQSVNDRQEVDKGHWILKAKVGRKYRLFANPLSVDAEFYYTNDDLRTKLTTEKKPSLTEQYLYENSVRLKKYGGRWSANYTYYFKEGNLRFYLPFNYEKHRVTDRTMTANELKGYFLLTPSVALTYNLRPQWKMSATASYHKTVSQLDDYYEAVILTGYRDFSTFGNVPLKSKRMRYNIGLEHRNILTSVFFHLNMGYQPTKLNRISRNLYEAEYTLEQKVAREVSMDKIYANARVSKLLSSLKTTLVVNTSYEYYKSEIGQQYSSFLNYSNQWSVGFEAYVKKWDWMSIQYLVTDRVFWENNRMAHTDKLHNLMQQLQLSFFAFQHLQWQISGEHNYNDIGGNRSYKSFFVDASASYKLKQVEFTLLLQNLLDKKEYALTTYSGVNSHSLKIPIRGRSLLVGASFRF